MKNPLISDIHPITPPIADAIRHPRLLSHKCQPTAVPITSAGTTAHQANRHLRKRLAEDLANHHDRPAFLNNQPLPPQVPRADDIEAMLAAFPGLHELDYDNPPTCPFNELDPAKWMYYHSLHCTNSPPCSSRIPAKSCYARPLLYMITHGFHAALRKDASLDSIAVHPSAYVSLWNRHPTQCKTAFKKLRASTRLRTIKDAEFIFPILPVIRGKDL